MTTPPILFVDDNNLLLDLFRGLLSEIGFEAECAHSGQEAVALCEGASAPPLAIVDLRMPGMDGLETIAAMRETQPDLKVIAMSGCGLQPYFGRLAGLGVRNFLPKPFTIEELVSNIREVAA